MADVDPVDFIAVDLGASSGRVLLGRWDGECFELTELHRFPNEPVRVLERLHWNVLELWNEIKTGLRAYADTYGDSPAGIGVATWGVDFALLDAHGKLLSNPVHYRDPRTVGMVERIDEWFPKEDVYATTGIQFLELNTLTQLLSLVDRQDPQLSAAKTLLMMPDLFHYWLSGVATSEYTNASTTQLLDADTRDWSAELLQRFHLSKPIFPEIRPPGTVIGKLHASVAEEVGLKAATPVITPATHDTASAVAAVPYLDEKSVYLSSGTWSLIGIEVLEPIINETMLRLNFTNEGGVDGTIRLLKNVAGMWLLEESRRQWQREGKTLAWDELLRLADEAPPLRSFIDPDDAAFGSPGDLPEAIRSYCRATDQTVPDSVGAVARTCLESLALKYRWVVTSLEQVSGRKLETIRVVGGGSQNALLNQFTADACGVKVVAGPVEATALGNVMMQGVATGHIQNVRAGREAVARSVKLQTFEPSGAQPWDKAYERFKDLLT